MLKTVKSKVIFAIISLCIVGLSAITLYFSSTLNSLSNTTTKQSLTMLSESIFQTLTTSMMMGDPEIVAHAFKSAEAISGIES